MLSGSNDSSKSADISTSRGSTLIPVNSPKLAHYVASSLKAPADRAFKQDQLKHGHQFYQRSILGGLLGIAFLALLGGVASAYFGYTLLSVVFVCIAGGSSAVNYWLNQSIPEFKTELCEKTPEKCTKAKEKCLDSSPKVIFRGISYAINYQPTDTEPKPTLEPETKKTVMRQ
ncbi:MAG: hypothetical protein AB7I18_00240 [Candidatus Berkiella sp.]